MQRSCKSEKRPSARAPANTLLISGAGGFIAKALLTKIDPGRKAVLLVRSKPKSGLIKNAPYLQCDITRKEELKKLKAIKGEVTLLHLAAFVPRVPSEEDRFIRRIFQTNIAGTVGLLEALKGKLKGLCLASTLEVYGIPRALPIKEDTAVDPVSIYGASKLASERCVRIFCKEHNVPFVILRLSSVYGPGEDFDRALPNFIKQALQNKPLTVYGDGSDKRDYIYVDDAAEALLKASDCALRSGLVNIASGESISIKELAERIISLCGSRSRIEFRERRRPCYDVIFDISRMKRLLKFYPRNTLNDGLLKEISWFSPKVR